MPGLTPANPWLLETWLKTYETLYYALFCLASETLTNSGDNSNYRNELKQIYLSFSNPANAPATNVTYCL